MSRAKQFLLVSIAVFWVLSKKFSGKDGSVPLEKIGPYTYEAECLIVYSATCFCLQLSSSWLHKFLLEMSLPRLLNWSQPELMNLGILFFPIACDITISLGTVLYWLYCRNCSNPATGCYTK